MTSPCSPLAPGPAAVARTQLFVSGRRPDRFDKAAAAAADLVIVNLEDAVRRRTKRSRATQWLGGALRTAGRRSG